MADISSLILRVDSEGVVRATRRLNEFSRQASRTEETTGTLDDVLSSLNLSAIASGAGILGLVQGLKKLSGLAVSSVEAFAGFESVKTNLQVVTGSAKEAEKQFAELKQLASATPFEVTGLANASIALQQVGVSSSEVTDRLRMLGDVAGGNNEMFNRISQNYAQILSVGKASSMDMKQFAMAGLPVYEMMKQMGIEGQATADQVTEMFRRMTQEGGTFFNGMSLQSESYFGMISTLNDTMKESSATFAEVTGLADLAKNIVGGLTSAIQKVTDVLNKVNEHPILKILLQGVLVAGVTTLVTLIGVTLIGALKAVIVKLTAIAGLQAIINPAKFAVGLGLAVGGVVALGGAFSDLSENITYTQGLIDNTVKSQEELLSLSNQRFSSENSLENEIAEYQKFIDVQKKAVKDAKAFFDETGSFQDKENLENAKKELEFAEDRMAMLKDQLQIEKDIRKEREDLLRIQENQNELQKEALQNIATDYENLVLSKNDKLDKKIAYYEDLLKQTKTVEYKNLAYGSFTVEENMFSPEREGQIKEILDALRRQKDKPISRKKDWLDFFQDVTGVDISEFRGVEKSGALGGEKFVASQKYELELAKHLAEEMGEKFDEKKFKEGQISDIKAFLKELLSIRTNDIAEFNLGFEKDAKGNIIKRDDIISSLLERLKELETELGGVPTKIEEITEEIKKTFSTFSEYFDNLVKEAKATDKHGFDKGMYTKGRAGQLGLQMVQGTDVGNFLQGMEQGGIWGGVFNTLLTALANVTGGMEGLNLILSPITEMFKAFEPTIKALLVPTLYITKALIWLGKGIQWVLNVITFGLIDKLSESWDSLVEESTTLTDNTKEVNNQMGSLTDRLLELQSAIDKQEQYYLTERMRIGAENQYKVNDMILTPQGRFSTNPKDTIIATKNPQDLVSGGNVNIVINNSQADSVNVSARQDGNKIFVDISKKIAEDFATGRNGWNNAVNYREAQTAGRRLS